MPFPHWTPAPPECEGVVHAKRRINHLFRNRRRYRVIARHLIRQYAFAIRALRARPLVIDGPNVQSLADSVRHLP